MGHDRLAAAQRHSMAVRHSGPQLLWLAAALLSCIAANLLAAARAEVELPMCRNKKIYVLDLNDFAGDNPPCYVDDVVVVNPGNGIVYTADAKLRERASHKYGTHSAPWYVVQAIKGSQYNTYDIDEADVVFVNSYCYYIWWLGWVHTKGREHDDTPGDYLIAALTAMVESPRFKKNQGRDYVFYDSHPGFTAGKAAKQYWMFMCHVFKHSMHIVVERAQRNVCPTYWSIEKKLLITPYVPNFPSVEQQYHEWELPLKPLTQRQLFLYSKARCTPWRIDERGQVLNVGKKMRHDFVTAMNKTGPTIQVECTDAEYGMQHETFQDMLAGMQNSTFCLGLPGDAASVRRLSEMFMAGCIPVFAGPPYATMPLPADVDYRAVGLFYNINQYHSWQTQDMMWELSPTVRANHPQNSWMWIPDADVQSLMVKIETVHDLVPDLRSIPQRQLDAMFEMMESQRQMFVFYDHLTAKWTAVNAIVSRICSMAGGAPKPKAEKKFAKALTDPEAVERHHKERQRRARRSHKAGEASQLRGEPGLSSRE